MLSRKTGYGILALGCVEANPKEWVLAKDIAGCTGIPLPFLAQVLHALRREGLLLSKRGSQGGVALARPAQSISLLEVVEALEGPNWFPPCLLALEDCAGLSACPTSEFWADIRQRIETELQRVTVAGHSVQNDRLIAVLEGQTLDHVPGKRLRLEAPEAPGVGNQVLHRTLRRVAPAARHAPSIVEKGSEKTV